MNFNKVKASNDSHKHDIHSDSSQQKKSPDNTSWRFADYYAMYIRPILMTLTVLTVLTGIGCFYIYLYVEAFNINKIYIYNVDSILQIIVYNRIVN